MSVILQSSSGGSVTLNEPTTASNFTVTLPAATGTVQVSGNMPAFSVYRSSNQSFTSNTISKIQFNAELFDTANCFDSTTNYRFTPNVAGYYQINAQSRIRGTSSDNKILYIYKNGSNYAAMDNFALSIEYFAISFSQVIYFNGTTDYVEVYGFSNGSNTTFLGDATILFTSFSGSLVRAA